MSVNDLVQKCNEAMRLGVDFPTLWNAIIKFHPAIMGPPVQRLDGNRTYLEVPHLIEKPLLSDTLFQGIRAALGDPAVHH